MISKRYMLLLAVGVSCTAQSGDIDSNTRWDKANELINGSLNVGINNKKTDLDINNSTVLAEYYFSIATCHGNSSSCPAGGIEANVNISNDSLVGASVAIIGDASKGVLNVDNSTLYTQQLWVSGNDNDANAGSDDSNGVFNINNKSKVYIASDMKNNLFPDVIKNNQWNEAIINSGNSNLVDGAGKGDLILGKTGNGVININDSMMSVEKDLVVSTGVKGQPNAKPSEIHMKNNATIRVQRDVRGGVSESGKLILTLDNKSKLITDKNISVGLGKNSNISIDGKVGSSLIAGNDFTVSTGGGSVADIQLDKSSLDVKGRAVIGAGENSKTTFHLKNLSAVTAIKGMTVAEGNNTTVDMQIADSSLSTGNLSVGKGEHAQVGMNVSNSTVRSPGEFVVAKGNAAMANLAYTNSRINIGDGSFGAGSGAGTKLELNKTVFESSGGTVIGAGDNSTTALNVINGSRVTANKGMTLAEGNDTSVDMKIADSSLSARNLSVGKGEHAQVGMNVSNSTVRSSGEFIVAKGNAAVADLTYTNSRISIGKGSLGAGSGAGTKLDLNNTVFESSGGTVIGAGDNSTTTLNVVNGSTVAVNKEMTLAEGNNTSVDMKIAGSGLSVGKLSVGKGEHAQVGMNVFNSTVRSLGEFVVAKGNSAVANLTYTNSRINIGEGSLGAGDKATTNLKLENATIDVVNNVSIGNGNLALTNININSGAMNSGGNARIGVGNGAVTKFNLNAGGISVSEDLVLAQGNDTNTEMNVRDGKISSKGLYIGEGKKTIVDMEVENSMINIEKSYTLAKGEGAKAELKYNKSNINIGNGSIGAGTAAITDLNLQNSTFNASKLITIGAGDESLTKIDVSKNTYFSGREVSIGSGLRSKNTININGNSTFNFGKSVSSTIGEGNESNSEVVVNHGSIIGDGTLTLAKGERSNAVLTLQENAITNANDITLAAGSNSKTIVNVMNSNPKQFNPRIMTAGKGYSEVNLDGKNGFELTTKFLCLDNRDCNDTEINIKRGNVSFFSKHDWKGVVNIYKDALLSVKNDYAINGTININKGSYVDLNGFNQNVVGVNNMGTLKLSAGSASTNLDINNNYYGEDGSKINFGVFGKKSADEIHVSGDTIGKSALELDVNHKVKRKKAGSILLIEVKGKSNGHFYLESLNREGVKYNVVNDHINVGAWEYELGKKNKDWYLNINMRPEPGAFINNSKSMINMFGLQRYDIPGQHIYPNLFENMYNNGVWIKYDQASGGNSEENGNLASEYSWGTAMLGADVYNWTDGYNYSQIGIMGGVGSAKNTTLSTNGKKASGLVNGYTVGAYHTYQKNITDGLGDSERKGLWTYAALQYMSYTSSVDSTNKFDANYNVNGYKVTGELGYIHNLLETTHGDYYLEPKLYSSYTELSGGLVKDRQGLEVKYSSQNLNVEPGMRLTYRKTRPSSSKSDSFFKDRIKQSAIEGWLGGGYSLDLLKSEKATFDGDEVNYKKKADIILTGGVEAEVSKSARMQITTKYLLNNENDLNIMFGGMYRF